MTSGGFRLCIDVVARRRVHEEFGDSPGTPAATGVKASSFAKLASHQNGDSFTPLAMAFLASQHKNRCCFTRFFNGVAIRFFGPPVTKRLLFAWIEPGALIQNKNLVISDYKNFRVPFSEKDFAKASFQVYFLGVHGR